MKINILLILVVTGGASLVGQDVSQTPAEIQQQKSLADQMPVAGAPAKFLTPLRTFETYFSSLARLDATEFQCLTSHAIKDQFGVTALTAGDLQNLKAGQQSRDERNYLIFHFTYSSDPAHPKITFGYTYDHPSQGGARATKAARERVTLVQTPGGWKIDLIEYDP